MDVQGSSVSFRMSHQAMSSTLVHQRVAVTRSSALSTDAASDRVSLSAQARQTAESADAEGMQEWAADPQLIALVRMIEQVTGRSVRVFDARALHGDAPPASDQSEAVVPANPPQPVARVSTGEGFGFELDARRVHREFESTTVRAEGRIRTADGVEIAFSLELAMSRSYREETALSVRLGAAPARKDPLVINFAGNAAELTDTRFNFDLNADGVSEALPGLGAGSGYLVLDRNHNGRVDDGRELFGALSGDGFADLASLDGDRDGWVDAADPEFARLQVWTPDAGSAGRLESLASRGVAALATARIASPFELRGEGNRELGAIRSTGVYLGSDHKVGTLQQVDLSV